MAEAQEELTALLRPGHHAKAGFLGDEFLTVEPAQPDVAVRGLPRLPRLHLTENPVEPTQLVRGDIHEPLLPNHAPARGLDQDRSRCQTGELQDPVRGPVLMIVMKKVRDQAVVGPQIGNAAGDRQGTPFHSRLRSVGTAILADESNTGHGAKSW